MPGIRPLMGRDRVHEDTEEGHPGQNGVQGRLPGVGRSLAEFSLPVAAGPGKEWPKHETRSKVFEILALR